MSKGIDYSFSRPDLATVKAAGYSFVCRYLSSASAKNISAQEITSLKNAGLDLVLVWENGAQSALGGGAQGASDAKAALALANTLGIPSGVPIFFAVDFDPSSADLNAIKAYFLAVTQIIGINRTGVYGGLAVVTALLDARLASFAWQTYAWSGGLWDSRAQLRQTLNGQTVAGGAVDIDESMSDTFGQWQLNNSTTTNNPPMDISILNGHTDQPVGINGNATIYARVALPSPEVAAAMGIDTQKTVWLDQDMPGIDRTSVYDLNNRLVQTTAERDQALQEVIAANNQVSELQKTITILQTQQVPKIETPVSTSQPTATQNLVSVPTSPNLFESIINFILNIWRKN